MLTGKNAVITGANTGIGNATVKKFAKNGANIWACARKYREDFELEMAELSKKYSVWIRPVYFDLSQKDEVESGAKRILDEKLPIDILINNAAINQVSLFMHTKIEDIKALFEVDFFNQLVLIQKLSKRMMRQKGSSIVNVISARALRAAPGRLAYSTAKVAMKLATETLALEFASSGMRVNAVAPGQVSSTRMMDELKSHYTTLNNTLGRFGEPEEIADAILFLSSEMSSYITGLTIEVSGGGG